MKLLALLCLLAALVARSNAAEKWSYQMGAANGPSNWGNLPGYATCSQGSAQTPINLQWSAATYRTYANNVTFSHGKSTFPFRIVNDGHSVAAFPVNASGVTLTGGPLGSATYRLYNVHIHFGGANATNSEHSFNGTRTVGEFHIVTYNSKFSDIGQAIASNEGNALAVVGTLFNARSTGTIDVGINGFVASAMNLTYSGDQVVDNLNFGQFFSDPDLRNYFAYSGSLTTPACSEVVQWIVVNRIHYVNTATIDSLLSLRTGINETSPGYPLAGNTRPLFPLNSRTLWRTFQIQSSSSSSTVIPSIAALIVLLAAAMTI